MSKFFFTVNDASNFVALALEKQKKIFRKNNLSRDDNLFEILNILKLWINKKIWW